MSGSIKVQNIRQFISDVFLKTANVLNSSLQNVTDKLGNVSTLFLATNQTNITPIGHTDSLIIGTNAGQATGSENTVALGVDAYTSGTGKRNTIIGKGAGYFNTTADDNTFIGCLAGLWRTTGGHNTAIGKGCFAGSLNFLGEENTFIGSSSGEGSKGNGNVGLGRLSHQGTYPYSDCTGDYNISIGYCANKQLTEGSKNISIGYFAYNSAIDANNELNIGNALYGININQGGAGTPGNDPQFAIGKTTPHASAILDLNSTTTRGFILPNMTTTERNAITSPADGLQVYDTTLSQMCFYSTAAGGWRKITDSPA